MDEKTNTPSVTSGSAVNTLQQPVAPPLPNTRDSAKISLDELLQKLGDSTHQPAKTTQGGSSTPHPVPKPPVSQVTPPITPVVNHRPSPPLAQPPRPQIVPPSLPPRPNTPPSTSPVDPPAPTQLPLKSEPLGVTPRIEPPAKPQPTASSPGPSIPSKITPSPLTKPPTPSSNQTLLTPLPPKPPVQTPASSSPSQPQPTTSSSPQNLSFRSSIRTMKDDLSSAKKGVTPEGVEIESVKHTTQAAPPAQIGTSKPITPPLQPQIHVELGDTKKTAPLKTAPTAQVLPPTLSSPSVNIGKITPISNLNIPIKSTGISKRAVIFVVVGIVVFGVGILGFFVLKNREIAVITPTPTESMVPTQTPPAESPIDLIFGGDLASITLPQTGEPYLLLKNFVDNHQVNIGSTEFYKINNESNIRYNFPGFLSRFAITRPEAINATDAKNELLFSTYENINKKNIGLIIPVANAQATTQAMRDWEQTITASLQTLFGINPQKRSSSVFLDNVYRGVSVRYLNFPDHDTTVDYAIVNLTPEINLLIITNSRDHIYSIIDQSQGF